VLSVDIEGRIGTCDLAVAFEAASGVTALVGPSGAGKSTVLRAIAGLWKPRTGKIVIGSKVILDTSRHVDIPAHKRRVGAVFQSALLFPHMSVERNLTYGMSKAESESDFQSMVDLLDIGALLKRMPRNLSGGETQRVAFGRALLSKPDLLLLDEPMTGLDENRRAAIIPYLVSLRERLTIPILYVTHRGDEVVKIAQNVVRIEDGCSKKALTIEAYKNLADDPSMSQG